MKLQRSREIIIIFFNYKTVKKLDSTHLQQKLFFDKFSLRSLKRLLKQYITSFQL